MRIDYHPAIAGELEEIRDHYESCSECLGVEFIDEFERQVLTIAAMPTRWMVEQGDVRRSLMKRFPFVILFRLISDDWIRITVIKHEKRHPAFGRSRRCHGPADSSPFRSFRLFRCSEIGTPQPGRNALATRELLP